MLHPFAVSRCAALALLVSGLVACGDSAAPGGGGSGGGSPDDGGASSTGGSPSSGGGPSTGGSASTGGSSSDGGAGGAGGSASSANGGGGAAQGCLQDLTAGHHQVLCAGNINYDVEIPAACTDGPCGLIVDMHGYTMNADAQDENTGMRALGQANGYVVVQPTAPPDNFTFPSWDQPTHVPLVYGFLADLANDLPIDPTKIHAMGFSQGGGMTFRLLCDHADFFASGAPIGALPGCEFAGPNMPSEEVDILQVHGRNDGVVNFNAQAIPQRDDVLGGWAFGAPTVLVDDGAHKATRWVTPGNTVFEFWEHDYETSTVAFFIAIHGHCVPGGSDFGSNPPGYSCEDSDTFVFGDLAMAFFQAHPKN